MSAIAREWIVILSFFLLFDGFIIGEAFWMNRKGWAGFGRSLGFSVLTNFIGYAIGFFVLFVVFGVFLAMSWDGSIEKFPMKNYGIGATLILAVLFTPALLTVCKRIFLPVLKIQISKSAWLYSLASSVLGLTMSVGIPILLGYLLFR
jgi:hypothetical protein